MTEPNSPPPPGEPVKVAEIPTHYPSSPLTNEKKKRLTVPKSSPDKGTKKRKKKGRERRTSHQSPVTNSLGRKLSNVRRRQEFHHRLITCLHGEQFRDLDIPASAHFPAHRLPDLSPELLLFFFPSPAVAKEVLPCLGCRSSAPPAHVVFSVSEVFQEKRWFGRCCEGNMRLDRKKV